MIGRILAHYEIIEQIGAGGMGEVYRARDTRLDRQVAIKLIPAALAHEPERLQRFDREAKLLASLNHPHIATLHDVASDGNEHFIAMELVEGDDLSQHLDRGRMPVAEAIRVAIQVAQALEAAHDQGVIHRDLKPANIKVTPEGDAKVLDFGLARAAEPDPGDPNISQSPTMTAGGTAHGVILGTAAYMSPEQARGKSVDKRTDIWAFGCVLFEMLGGRQVFAGETVSDTIARILEREPEWATLPDRTPPRVRRVLERCLEKDMRRRLRDIADARVELEDALAEGVTGVAVAAAPGGVQRPRVPWLLGGIAAGMIVGAVLVWALVRGGEPAAPLPTTHLSFPTPDNVLPSGRPEIAISPDGRTVVFGAYVGDDRRLFVRDLGGDEVRMLFDSGSGSEPTFSPDGRSIAFLRPGNPTGRLVRIPTTGGPERVLAELEGFSGGVWTPDDEIIIPRTLVSGLVRVPAGGGEPKTLTRPDTAAGEFAHWCPSLMPDGEHVLFHAWKTRLEDARIKVVSLRTGEEKVILEGGAGPLYSQTGHLLYVFRSALMAAPFDLERLEITGESVPVLDPVQVIGSDGRAEVAISDNGTLVYLKARDWRAQLLWLYLDGNKEPVLPELRDYDTVRMGRDGRRAFIDIDTDGKSDIWALDLERGSLTPVTFDGTNSSPAPSPDGRTVAFRTMRRGPFEVFTTTADGSGSAQPLFELEKQEAWPMWWTPDGAMLLFSVWPNDTGTDIRAYSPSDGSFTPIVTTRFSDGEASVSPDGRWVAYETTVNNVPDIYVSPIAGGPRVRVTNGGAGGPRWAPDGHALYYWASDENIHRVQLSFDPEPRVGQTSVAIPAHQHGGTFESYDLHPDGTRFIAVINPKVESLNIRVVLNWAAELERLVPVAQAAPTPLASP